MQASPARTRALEGEAEISEVSTKPTTARELLRNRADETREGEHAFCLTFDEPRQIEIERNFYELKGIVCIATRIFTKHTKS